MAISEQKKVPLCDGAARLPLNLFVSTPLSTHPTPPPPYFQPHSSLQVMELQIASCRHYQWVSVWCQFLAIFLLRFTDHTVLIQKYLHSRIAKITAYSTNIPVFSVFLESLQTWQCMDMYVKVFCSYILLLLALVSHRSWKQKHLCSQTQKAYCKAKSLLQCLYVIFAVLPYKNKVDATKAFKLSCEFLHWSVCMYSLNFFLYLFYYHYINTN